MAEYNGWTNYETWAVKLWMDNDEEGQEYFTEMAGEVDGDTHELARQIEDYHDRLHEEIDLPLYGVFADLLNSAMSEVNWYEIAENVLSEMD